MVGDGEERERESVWATQGEREAVDGLGDGEEIEREAVGGLGDGKEREREAVGGLGDGEEREREAVGTTVGEREIKVCFASARREREETKRMNGDCQKLDIALMEIGKTTKAK
ncbi:hypothetical protein TIFTF001_014065 [Ficus carica]|uniref:Uncharacterized protein n=1 Tax=Ficus carica TaxID=3494 RepID=A0AA88A5F3_FICCA|nr:hypothetical protein TIFTF001_014065 [Ficus carica]